MQDSIYLQVIQKVTLLDYLNKVLGLNIKQDSLPKNISCPTHKDNKPSLRLYSPAQNQGYCFSCGKAYNAITIHQALTNSSVAEAIDYLQKTFRFAIDKKQMAYKATHKNIINKDAYIAKALAKDIEYLRQNPKSIHTNFNVFVSKIQNAMIKSN